jgi:hypothetical protein
MLRKLINISILLLLAFGSEAVLVSFAHAEALVYSDCPVSNSDDHCLGVEMQAYLPEQISHPVLTDTSTLSDQGFVSSIFRPPASIL